MCSVLLFIKVDVYAGTMILGSTLALESKMENPEAFIFFPLVAHAFDLVVSGVGIYVVRCKGDSDDPLSL